MAQPIELVSLHGWRVMGAWHFVLSSTTKTEDLQVKPGPGLAWSRTGVTDDTLADLMEYLAEDLFGWAPVIREGPPV